MTKQRMQELIETHINGNQSIVRKAIKNMTKRDMFDLMIEWSKYEDWDIVIGNINSLL
jgi:hypothetical protein